MAEDSHYRKESNGGKRATVKIVDRDGNESKDFHRPGLLRRSVGTFGGDMVVRNAGPMGVFTGEYGRITDQIRKAGRAVSDKRKD